ncbi:hypothetical protein HUJ04_007562 [Dendroctonus ponderosae]|nr:hypothetical protein HUJ04_007562 [Dendroctonus ponderosae]
MDYDLLGVAYQFSHPAKTRKTKSKSNQCIARGGVTKKNVPGPQRNIEGEVNNK